MRNYFKLNEFIYLPRNEVLNSNMTFGVQWQYMNHYGNVPFNAESGLNKTESHFTRRALAY